MQLPHFTEELVRALSNRRSRSVRSIQDLANMNEQDRRQALWSLSDDQYRDAIEVLKNMPKLTVKATPEVIDVDDEDPSITAGSIVTVTVSIRRGSLAEQMKIAESNAPKRQEKQAEEVGEEDETKKKELKPWQRPKKKQNKNKADPRQLHRQNKQKQVPKVAQQVSLSPYNH